MSERVGGLKGRQVRRGRRRCFWRLSCGLSAAGALLILRTVWKLFWGWRSHSSVSCETGRFFFNNGDRPVGPRPCQSLSVSCEKYTPRYYDRVVGRVNRAKLLEGCNRYRIPSKQSTYSRVRCYSQHTLLATHFATCLEVSFLLCWPVSCGV